MFPLLGKEGVRGRSVLTQHFNRRTERNKRKTLRANPTEAEQRLWRHLRGKRLGTKFHRQYSVDTYVLDFYAPTPKLAIEIDGDSHFTSQAVEYDRMRTRHLRRFGIEVLRFTNLDVFENIAGVLDSIEAAVKRGASTSP